jgi:hypothetical protein
LKTALRKLADECHKKLITQKNNAMKKKTITTALLLFCFFVSFATIENLNGRWTGLLKTDQGDEYPLLYNFKIAGDQLTGTAKTPKGDMTINDGKITGDTFTFNVIVNNMEIDHSGKFYGDSVGVDISLGDAKSHATLKRVQ